MRNRRFSRAPMAIVLAVGLSAATVASERGPSGPVPHLGAPSLAADPSRAPAPLCMYPPSPVVFPVPFTKVAGTVARMGWEDQGRGYGHDVVRGSLSLLSATGGDFTVATQVCLLNDSHDLSLDDPDVPEVGEGYWYLIRTDQVDGCPGWGGGSFADDPAFRRVGDRDTGILNSGRDCGCFYFWDGQCC